MLCYEECAALHIHFLRLQLSEDAILPSDRRSNNARPRIKSTRPIAPVKKQCKEVVVNFSKRDSSRTESKVDPGQSVKEQGARINSPFRFGAI
jgi:hypothetical protein